MTPQEPCRSRNSHEITTAHAKIVLRGRLYVTVWPRHNIANDFLRFTEYFEKHATVKPHYNEVLRTINITLLYRVSHYIRVKKQRDIKSWDQQNYLVIRGFCYIRPRYNEVPLYPYNNYTVYTTNERRFLEADIQTTISKSAYLDIKIPRQHNGKKITGNINIWQGIINVYVSNKILMRKAAFNWSWISRVTLH